MRRGIRRGRMAIYSFRCLTLCCQKLRSCHTCINHVIWSFSSASPRSIICGKTRNWWWKLIGDAHAVLNLAAAETPYSTPWMHESQHHKIVHNNSCRYGPTIMITTWGYVQIHTVLLWYCFSFILNFPSFSFQLSAFAWNKLTIMHPPRKQRHPAESTSSPPD